MLQNRAHNYAEGHLTFGTTSRQEEPQELIRIAELAVLSYTGSRMLPVVCHEIEEMRKSLCGLQYNLDHTTCFMKMDRKLGAGIKGRLIIDSKNFYRSSCARQAPDVKEFIDSGGEIRILKPK